MSAEPSELSVSQARRTRWPGHSDCDSARRYAVAYDPTALKELSKLDKPVARRIARAVDELGTDPPLAGCRALTGYSGLWCIRIGDHQVI